MAGTTRNQMPPKGKSKSKNRVHGERIQIERWTEEQLASELEKQFKIRRSADKISAELAKISGWKKAEIGKFLKARAEQTKRTRNKAHALLEEKQIAAADPETIVCASKRLAEFVEWQDSLLCVPGSKFYRVRKWGDPVMVEYGFDVNQVNTSNFQAVALYNNGNKEFGAVSNFIRISHDDVIRLKALQIDDDYESKRRDWRSQKMNWLCKFRGTIYMFDNDSDQWQTAPYIRWGTLALGGNLVQVMGTESIRAKMRDGTTRRVEMAHLKGFTASDWNRPLDDLLAEGVVHRCFCAYENNHFGDSPKGIIYSPFYSPQDWDFTGTAKATALYIPVEWLEPKD